MSYEVTHLLVGIFLILAGLVGKVKAEWIEVGTSSRMARIVIALIGIVLLVLSFNPEIPGAFLPAAPEKADEATPGGSQKPEMEAEPVGLAE